jgi:hypothetical protein
MDVNSPAKWERDYQRGTAGWDMGTSTPVFQRLLAEGQFQPGRMIVPGAGRGHDAREFARHGFEVVAVDFAQDAARAMRERMTPESAHQILEQDFFQLPPELDGTFDYVLEYTCYCAIDPGRRAEYAGKVAHFLRRGGIYIALVFPLDEHQGGPPFAVNTEKLVAMMEQRGLNILRREFPPDSVKPRKGLEELLIMQR